MLLKCGLHQPALLDKGSNKRNTPLFVKKGGDYVNTPLYVKKGGDYVSWCRVLKGIKGPFPLFYFKLLIFM